MDELLYLEIERLCRLTRERGLQELAITQPEFSLSITAMPADTIFAAHPPVAMGNLPATLPVEEALPGHLISSPLIGLYYRAPSPDSPDFVEIGDTVEVGQTIGIVEAMKVFNEITSDHAGIVTAIPVENGALVQVGQVLIVLDPIE